MTTTYTATVAIIDPEGNVLLTAGQATDTIEPAPEGTPSTLDDLENFAIRRQEGYEPTEEEFEEKWWASELYFRHPCGDVATFRL